VDTDEVIVARHGPIPELFARQGDAAFRAHELDAVRDTLDGPPAVVALGGGAVTHEATRALLAQHALRIYLEVPVESLVARLRRSRTVRPVLGDEPTPARVRELLAAREGFYREAEIVVRGARRSKAELALEIAALVRTGNA
jgi:shikimate kinase